MKVLLVALDSKFIHSNLAVRYLKAYTEDLNYQCKIKEYTVNDRIEKILEGLVFEKPDVLAFSCYIWNIEYVKKLCSLFKLISKDTKILFGGPEVSYDSLKFLKDINGDFLIKGEGEETYRELICELISIEKTKKIKDINEDDLNKLKNIKGMYTKINTEVYFSKERALMDINNIKFPYGNLGELNNKIIYYEASRGCPFNCKYCLSSTTRGVRFLNIERVKTELKWLTDNGVKLVKFVDRTFNCNKSFAMEIWKYLIELDTDCTFHFEISADLLSKEEISLLKTAPKERIQFEVGVQTTNKEVLKNINRNVNFTHIKEKVQEMLKVKNIKQHLDLIAGLPGEDFSSFKESFNDVYSIRPEEIQLGFLKLLRGSKMRAEAEKWGMIYSPYPPYEILSTKDISYEELISLKRVEEVVDRYYNSRKFSLVLEYMIDKFDTAFQLYYDIGSYLFCKGYFSRNISNTDYYEALLSFYKEKFNKEDSFFKEILKFEYLLFNKKRWLPPFLPREVDKEAENIIKEKIKKREIEVADKYHIEKFNLDMEKYINNGLLELKETFIIFGEEKDDIIFYRK